VAITATPFTRPIQRDSRRGIAMVCTPVRGAAFQP
jgi:hypothetical protein